MRPLTGERFRARVFTSEEVRLCDPRVRPRFQATLRALRPRSDYESARHRMESHVGGARLSGARARQASAIRAYRARRAAFEPSETITVFHFSITHTAKEANRAVIAES